VVVGILVLLFNFISTKCIRPPVYAIGATRRARLSGINIKALNMTIFIIMGFVSHLRHRVHRPAQLSHRSAGNLFELDAIAAIIAAPPPWAVKHHHRRHHRRPVMGSLNNGMQLLNIETSTR